VSFSIAPDHPALSGHFPGRPIVPGVLLLDAVLRAIVARDPGMPPPDRLLRAKFLAPVLPGQEVALELDERRDGRIAFSGRVAGAVVLRGECAASAASRPGDVPAACSDRPALPRGGHPAAGG
jgi:3-hydroxymyristoyl/3-hydroxydecanoyl-(acyl carrier protein) dehydratase